MARFFHIRPKILYLVIAVVLIYLLIAHGNNWVKYKDSSLGFSIEHPPGWNVEVNSNNHLEIISQDGKAAITVYPFLQQTDTSASYLVNLYARAIKDSSTVEDVGQGPVNKLDSNIPDFDQAAGSITYTDVSDGTSWKEGVLINLYQQSGMFYSIKAPADKFDEMKGTLNKVLQTLSFNTPSEDKTSPSTKGDERIKYVQWPDPKETAFTVEVPENWDVTGGIERYGSGVIKEIEDFRTIIRMASPEGIHITFGDENVPLFDKPNPQMAGGTGEERLDLARYGSNSEEVFLHAMNGAEFAEYYVNNYLAKEYGFANVEITDRNELNYHFNPAYNLGDYFGEVYFTCSKNGKTLNGHYLAGTEWVPYSWRPTILFGYVAPESEDNLANAVLAHMISSFTWKKEWITDDYNRAISKGIATSKSIDKAFNEIQDTIMGTYNTNSQMQEKTSSNWENAMLGQTEVVNPDGIHYIVASGHNYYWQKGTTGNVGAATETYDRPDTDFVALKEV